MVAFYTSTSTQDYMSRSLLVDAAERANHLAYAEQRRAAGLRGRVLRAGESMAFDVGRGSYLTQVLGFGMKEGSYPRLNSPVPQLIMAPAGAVRTLAEQLRAIVEFYGAHQTTAIELSSLAPIEAAQTLVRASFQPVEHTNLLVLPLDPLEGLRWDPPDLPDELEIVTIRPQQPGAEPYLQAVLEGFGIPVDEENLTFQRLWYSVPGTYPIAVLAADAGRRPVAGGSLYVYGEVALLSGASTLLAFRNQGIQRLMIQHRLHFAQQLGCRLAAVLTTPGSTSENNMRRLGFQIYASRTKYVRG